MSSPLASDSRRLTSCASVRQFLEVRLQYKFSCFSSNHFNNSKLARNGTRARTELAHDERNTKGFVSVKKSPHVEKIMEKVKELSFKPVEVLEKEEEALREQEVDRKNGIKITANGLLNNFKNFDAKEAENCRKPSKNVFKITKIDLVLKSDNYGKNHLAQSNRWSGYLSGIGIALPVILHYTRPPDIRETVNFIGKFRALAGRDYSLRVR